MLLHLKSEDLSTTLSVLCIRNIFLRVLKKYKDLPMETVNYSITRWVHSEKVLRSHMNHLNIILWDKDIVKNKTECHSTILIFSNMGDKDRSEVIINDIGSITQDCTVIQGSMEVQRRNRSNSSVSFSPFLPC